MDLNKLRSLSQEGKTDLENKVLQLCNPQQIAQQLERDLEANATKCAKEGKHEAAAVFCCWFESKYRNLTMNRYGPFDDNVIDEKRQLSKVLFEMVKKYVSDDQIELSLDYVTGLEHTREIICARISWAP